MKYEKSFSVADLDFAQVGYKCPDITGVVMDIANRYKREVNFERDVLPHLAKDLRTAIQAAMCDSMDEYVRNHDDADPDMVVIADEVEAAATDEEYSIMAKGFTLKSNSRITLSIAREVFSFMDEDELMAIIEDEFLDLLIIRVKGCAKAGESKPSSDNRAKDDEVQAAVEAFAASVPANEPECSYDDAEEVEYEEVEEPDFHGYVPVETEEVEMEDEEESPESEEADEVPEASDDDEPSDEDADEPECETEDADPIANLEDPHNLLRTYRSHFEDIIAVPDVANAQRNVMSRDGNYIVLTSTIIKDDGYKLETVTKYDAKNKGKSCRTTENDGNETHIWSWRTPSLYGWALATLPEDGGDFDDEVLSKTLVEKGAGSCKAWGVRFIPTPKEERNRNRGNNGANGSGKVEKPKTEPKVEPKAEEPIAHEVDIKVDTINAVEITSDEDFDNALHEYQERNDNAEVNASEPEPKAEHPTPAPIPERKADHPEWSKDTAEFIGKFESDETFRKEVLDMVYAKTCEAERAKAEEEARAKKGKGRAKHSMFDAVMRRMKHGKAAYVYGPAGTGKNVLAEQVAEALGIPFAPINCLFEKFEVTGFAKPDGTLQETTIYLAVKFGWLLFWDEADTSAPQAGNVMNSLFSNGYIDFPVVGRVYAHPNFRCIAAGNTNGRGGDSEYTGRTCLDAATLNRFKLFKVDYDYNVEVAICKKRGYDEQPAEFIEDFRQAVRNCGFQHIVSYRQLDDMLDDLDDKLPIEDAIRESIVRDMPDDDLRMVARQLQKARNQYSAACRRMSDKYSAAI